MHLEHERADHRLLGFPSRDGLEVVELADVVGLRRKVEPDLLLRLANRRLKKRAVLRVLAAAGKRHVP